MQSVDHMRNEWAVVSAPYELRRRTAAAHRAVLRELVYIMQRVIIEIDCHPHEAIVAD